MHGKNIRSALKKATAVLLAAAVLFSAAAAGGLLLHKKGLLPGLDKYLNKYTDPALVFGDASVAFIKEGDLYVFEGIDSGTPVLAVKNYAAENSGADMMQLLPLFTVAGGRVFYPRDMSGGRYSLYYKPLKAPDAAGKEVDSGLSDLYAVSPGGGRVAYCKGSELFISSLRSCKKIASGVDFWCADLWLTRVMFGAENADGGFALSCALTAFGSNRQYIIDSKVSDIIYTSSDLGKIYYTKDDACYCSTGKGKTEKIISGISRCLGFCSDGTFYFSRFREGADDIRDYFEDDLLISDAQIKKPDENDYMVPFIPGSSYKVTGEQYYADLEAYKAKLARDEFRKTLAGVGGSGADVSEIYYFDGKNEQLLSARAVEYYSPGSVAPSSNLDSGEYLSGGKLVFAEKDAQSKVKMSQLSAEEYTVEAVAAKCEKSLYIAEKDAAYGVKAKGARSFTAAGDGKWYFMSDTVLGSESGSGCVNEGTVSRGELGSKEIMSGVDSYFVAAGETVAALDYDEVTRCHNMYVGGEMIARGTGAAIRSCNGGFCFGADYGGSLYTLCRYKGGEVSELSKNVYLILSGGSQTLVIGDYSEASGAGTLKRINDSGVDDLAQGVSLLMPSYAYIYRNSSPLRWIEMAAPFVHCCKETNVNNN